MKGSGFFLKRRGRLTVALALATFTLVSSVAVAGGAATSIVRVFDFSGVEQGGTSKLVRTSSGVSFNLRTVGTGVFPGYAFTLWVVVFNEPENCITPDGAGGTVCGEDDVFINPIPANVDVLYGAGNVVGAAGRINLAGHRAQGDNSGSVYALLGIPAPGLVDPLGAEFHLVLRSHGPKVPGEMPAQIHSFGGGCLVEVAPPGVANEVGECADSQFAVHLP